MIKETLVLLKNIRQAGYKGTIEEYQQTGGYSVWKKVLKDLTPDDVKKQVKDSGLRGRGGAGFPTGFKWGFMADVKGKPNYLVCNADEGEPGTFKDRELMIKDPHLFLEGMLISCFAVKCNTGYIYVRGEYYEAIKILKREIAQLNKAKFLGDNILGSGYSLKLVVHSGAGAYICGEETALLDSLEGKRGLPRVKPPFPAVSGFNACPTSVNNVETLANVPFIMEKGAEAFKANGTINNAGTRLISVSGLVKRPGVYEIKMGVNLKDIIYDFGGGTLPNRTLKAVIPGGSSSPVLLADEIDIGCDFDCLQKAKSMLGSAGVVVLDDTVDMPRLLHRLIEFYAHESCGQCTPCREGLNWIRILLRDLLARRLEKSWVDQIYRIAGNITGTTLCALGDAGAIPVMSFIDKFREEFLGYCK
ncbi:MAG: NADH-quinone oxidoreductase subunit NuoF [SAR324 cluster bacterium]|nr:NADH-quinone oxidoreductase subunit NuoF [SAR324 cluster bacterium]